MNFLVWQACHTPGTSSENQASQPSETKEKPADAKEPRTSSTLGMSRQSPGFGSSTQMHPLDGVERRDSVRVIKPFRK